MIFFRKPVSTFRDHALSHPARQPQHEDQHFGDGLVELGRNLVAKLDLGERAGQDLVLLDRDVMGFCDLDDLRADRALALGDHARRAGAVVMQRYRKLVDIGAHSARSRKWPPGVPFGCGGVPSRTTMSPGFNSARARAWLSSVLPARSRSAVAGRSAHIRTDVLSPISAISA